MRKKIIAVLLAAAMAVSAAACGASDQKPAANNSQAAKTTDKAESGESEAASKAENTGDGEDGTFLTDNRGRYPGTASDGEVTMNIKSEPPQLFSITTTDATSLTILRHIMEPLVTLDENDEITEGVAKTWDKSEDGLVYTFQLREDMKWSNGEPVTAHDFVYAWTSLLDPAFAAEYSYYGYIFKNGEAFAEGQCSREEVGVKALSDYELEVTLEQPTEYALGLFAFGVMAPLNQKAYEEFGDAYGTDADKMATNGAFTIDSWEHSSRVVLKKNPDFYRADEVEIEAINVVMINENNASLNAFKTGELDITELTADQRKTLNKEGFDTNYYLDGGTWYLEFNMLREELANQKMRQAIGQAINAEVFVNNIREDESMVATSFVSPSVKGLEKQFYEEVGQDWAGYDPEKAKELYNEALKELGIDSYSPAILSDDSDSAKKYAAFIQEQLKSNLGIDATIDTMPFKSRLQKMTDKDFDVVIAGWSPDYNDPYSFLEIFETGNGNNHTSYSSAEYDALLEKASTEVDAETRMGYLYELDKLLMTDVPITPIYWRAKDYAVTDKIASGVVRTALQDINLKYTKLR